MLRREFIQKIGIGCTSVSLLNGTLFGKNLSTKKKKNVLFISVDDLRTQLGCYGHEETKSPNIDRIASEGLLFERAYCQQAICSPSRISLLSGMRCETTKIYGLKYQLSEKWPDIISLPHLFKRNGYETISIGKIYHHSKDDLNAWSKKPFRAMKGSGYITEEGKKIVDINKATNPSAGSKGPVTEMADAPDNHYSDGKLADKAIEELNHLKNKAFFLAVGFRKPHLPFTAPKKYWDMYDPEKFELAENNYPPENVTTYSLSNYGELRNYYKMPKGKDPVNDEMARHLIHGYNACVSFIDAQIGRIMNHLEELGIKDNTTVILWGDHGWKLGEHGSWCKHTNFEIDCNAPLIISDPSMKNPGKKTKALTEFVDIYPSLCDLHGLEKPNHLDGYSFLPLLNEPNLPWKKAVFSIWVHKKYRYDEEIQIIGYTMKTDRYRYTEWKHTQSGVVKTVELYDHRLDQQENSNVVDNPEYATDLVELKEMMKKGWKSALPDSK